MTSPDCARCGHSISTAASVCPACVHPLPRSAAIHARPTKPLGHTKQTGANGVTNPPEPPRDPWWFRVPTWLLFVLVIVAGSVVLVAGVLAAASVVGTIADEWEASNASGGDSEHVATPTAPPPDVTSIRTGRMDVNVDTTLDEDHYGQIFILSDDVTLDCAGHTVSGGSLDPTWSGIHLRQRSGVTIRNCVVDDFNTGFEINSSSQNTFEDNTISNARQGFTLQGSDNNRLLGNSVVGASDWFAYGLFGGSDSNEIRQNSASATSGIGFMIQGANNNLFVSNVASGNYGNGFGANSPATGNVYTANTANNNTNHDFEDNTSSGYGDFGTDNHYSNGICDGRSSPTSVC
jgi:parallel beta-helix repeat protein